ncbi:MAG: hypothetical protein EBW67_01915 [Actinobacteria bacterium]|nr:hypothetical protein [Actinomycetota bacterium]
MASSSRFSPVFWGRWFWRQLTSMRTALFLLLLLALAAIPGSLYPQRSADPNGVRLYYDQQPEFAALLDSLQLFDVYTSVWFSAIYILLFVSLVGCVLPRTQVHLNALRAKPVETPQKLERMPAYLSGVAEADQLLGVCREGLPQRDREPGLSLLPCAAADRSWSGRRLQLLWAAGLG